MPRSPALRHPLLRSAEGWFGCKVCFQRDRSENTTRGPPTHREQTLPSETVVLMQELTRNRLSQREVMAFCEFKHAPDNQPAVLRMKAAIVRKTRQGSRQHLI